MLPERILIVAPHADDEVIGCGGLLARAHREGKETAVVVVTVEHTDRMAELEQSAAILGVSHVTALWDVPFLDRITDSEIVGRLDLAMEKYRPQLVCIPSMAGYHQEHRRVAGLAVSAMRPGLARTSGADVCSVWYYEAPADVSSPTGAWSPTITVELSELDLKKKLDAMKAHASQCRAYPSERSVEALEALARLRGCQIGVKIGEAYAPRRMVI